MRGAARVQVTGSLSAVAMLVFALVGLAALCQTRHEFVATGSDHVGGTVAAAAVAVPGAALIVGELVDIVVAAPRFDRRVRRGLPALVGAGAAGAAVGYLILRSTAGFGAAPGAFLGAALGVLAALLAVATAFVEFTTPVRRSARRNYRAVGATLLPLCLLAPVSFLLCLAVRR